MKKESGLPKDNQIEENEIKTGLTVRIRKILTGAAAVLSVFFITLSVLLAASITWMFRTWNHLTMDELMYQLQAPMDGTNRNMIMDYIKSCIPATVIVLIAAISLLVIIRKRKVIYRIAVVLLFVGAAAIIGYHIAMAISAQAIASSKALWWCFNSISRKLETQSSETLFGLRFWGRFLKYFLHSLQVQ